MRYYQLHDLLRFMKSAFPYPERTPYPFVMRRMKISSKNDGDCQLKTRDGSRYFLIRINKTLPEYYAIDVLLHEIGHCISWDENAEEMHGASWGEAYSMVYRKFLEWTEK